MQFKYHIQYPGCLWSTFYLVVNAAGFFTSPVLSCPGPIPGNQQAPARGRSIDTLTKDWFPSQETMRSWLKFVPEVNTCVFYTGNLTHEARSFASSSNHTTIWDVYPNEIIYISKSNVSDETNKMFYFLLDEQYTEFCSGTAWLMMPTGYSACVDSAWKSTEYTAMTRKKSKIDMNQIQVVDEKGKRQGLHNPQSGAPESCLRFPRFTGNDPINYWGN